jgi:hypothetical protein
MSGNDRDEAADPLASLAVGGAVAGAMTGVVVGQAWLGGLHLTALAVAGAVAGSCALALVGAYLIEPLCRMAAGRFTPSADG